MPTIATPIREAGLKATAQRQIILATLMKSRTPLDAETLHKAHRQIDIATIYRILDQFQASGMVSLVMFKDGKKRYECVGTSHHHHLVCDDCGKVTDITIPDEEYIMAAVTKRHGFQTRSHAFELFGLCKACQ